MKRIEWTPERIEYLKKAVAAGKSDTEIATELLINTWQVQRYRKKHLKINYRQTWTPEDIATLKKYIAEGVSMEDIVSHMGRSVGSIQRKKEKLGLRYEQPKLRKDCPKTVAQIIKFLMAGWTQERIAKVFGVRHGGQISNILRANGFSSWRLKPKGQRAGIPTPNWTELELHLLRKGLKRGDSPLKLQEALPRRSAHAIRLKAHQMTRFWRSPEEVERDRKKQRAWTNREKFYIGGQMPTNLENLKQDLLNDHWLHAYNWSGISIQKLSERYNCSMDDVRSVMLEIQKAHPKPKATPRTSTCKYCGAEIVWIGKHPCDPPVLKGVTADEKVHSFRQSHFTTCPHANKARRAS